MTNHRYAIICERPVGPGDNWSAYAPDLPGCVAVGDTREACERSMAEAIEFHLDGMREDGDPIPEPATYASMLEVAA